MTFEKGFTLIEIIVVISIIAIIISFGMTIDLGVFKRDLFKAEQSTIVSVLEKARSRSMANMFESAHGVCYDSGTDNYIIFRDTCGSAFTEFIPANANIEITFPTVTFDQLTGNSNSASDIIIHMKDGVKETDITINHEGKIDW